MKRKKIGIIGAGFSGIMTAVHLLRSGHALDIFICGEKAHFARGIAYTPYSKIQLLNVIAAKMSAFPDAPEHFLDYVAEQKEYAAFDKKLTANAFVPRFLFGDYLEKIWRDEKKSFDKTLVNLEESYAKATGIKYCGDKVEVCFDDGEVRSFDFCVLATGNQVPRNPAVKNPKFFESNFYFQNPWSGDSVSGIQSDLPVLILGNGLTMVDTVLGLLEKKVKNNFISLSPNGFNILPHRHNGLQYGAFTQELREDMNLRETADLLFTHIRKIRRLGLSAEPVIDSLRPHTQRIWQKMSDSEKAFFMSRFRHLWGVARHRIPLHIHDKIQNLRIEGRLSVLSGKVIDLEVQDGAVLVSYFDKKKKAEVKILASRVINCTGPETDLGNLPNYFLHKSLLEGVVTQDALKLGINADPHSFALLNSSGKKQPRLLTLGGNLKGVLWESTAVNELRTQARDLAQRILQS